VHIEAITDGRRRELSGDDKMEYTAHSRRRFLAGAGGLGLSWVAGNWPAIAAAGSDAATAAKDPASAALVFLTPNEGRDVEAIAAQIVPTDDLPGALEAGALYFIDRSLNTWAAATAARFRAGLGEFRAKFAAVHPSLEFAAAGAVVQVEFLTQVETTEFFASVRFLTLLGMFASPSYGGNRDGAGWRLIGFEHAHAFAPPFGYYDRGYPGFQIAKDKA
jgi:gluconate 2-dehydrogenase gamma chain